ncbi:MAG: hypothetical protein KGQ66_11605 [Acidobacteriota bacterium]|nr:hypothetical protein [Acidobacteriota bacterium]
MIDALIQTSFVSETIALGFADAAEAVEGLSGGRITVGRARLEVGRRGGDGLAGALWLSGVLHTGSVWMRPVPVDIVVSPWSSGRTEIGLRPLGRIGGPSSLRAERFYEAAGQVLTELVTQLKTPASAPVRPAEVQRAAV